MDAIKYIKINLLYMKTFDTYIILAFAVKIIFVILAVLSIYYKHKKPANVKSLISIDYWKDRSEFLFKTMIALLLIYIFNPYANNMYLIDKETKFLFYLFGFIVIFTENWSLFISEPKDFRIVQNIIGRQ